jgi:hypothetical protein
MAVRLWKKNLILEDIARQKWKKMWSTWGLFWGLIDVWQSKWLAVSWIWITKPSMTFWQRKWVCGHLDAAWRLCSLSHCHLHEGILDQRVYSSGCKAPTLAWSESVWILPLPKTQIPPQRSSFWNCGQHLKVMTDQLRVLPALLLGFGMSLVVCGFPRELLWRGWCWFLVQLLIKNVIAPVSLILDTSFITFQSHKCSTP